MNEHTQLIAKATVTAICASREKSLSKMKEAAAALAAAYGMSDEASKAAFTAHGGAIHHHHSKADVLFSRFDPVAALAAYQRDLDQAVWRHLLSEAGMRQMMDREALAAFEVSLTTDAVEATEENVRATLERLMMDRELIFRRGLVNAFCKLDRRFKSHDGFKIGARVIFERAFDDWGHANYGGTWDTIADVERVLAVLDGDQPDRYGLRETIHADRNFGRGPRQSETEARFFRINGFKNGNAHLWFTRKDLVEKANQILADHYGQVLPDAYAESDGDGLFRGTAVSKDLQFYRTPDALAQSMLDGLGIKGKRVLEPSAGDGSIALKAAAAGALVFAIEVDEARCDAMRALARRAGHVDMNIRRANFLATPAVAAYDYVLMNPPFYGTHWMDHVRHAFDHLTPGGILRCILPASAEVNETPKHLAFRKWAAPFYDYGWRGGFEELPEGSFGSSGTNIQTVILHLRKK